MSKKLVCLLLSLVLVMTLAMGIQAAEDSVQYVQLDADTDGLDISNDMLLDLNGYHVTNATVAEGVTLQLMDSKNDDYKADECGSFSGTVNGIVAQVVKTTEEQVGAIKSYLVINEDGIYSAHRFYAGITHISLVPGTAALGYKAQFFADEEIGEMVTGYGYTMWANNNTPRTYFKEGKIADQELTLRVRNILVEGNDALNAIGATANIGGKAVIRFQVDGAELIVDGTDHNTTLQEAVESVNSALGADRSAYTPEQVDSVKAFYHKFETYMESWVTDYILSEDKFVAVSASSAYGETLTLGQLFTAVEGATIGENVTVTVEGVDATYSPDADWTQATVTFNGIGTAKITITDNDLCWSATNTVEVAPATPDAPVVEEKSAIYGQTLADIALGDNLTWKDSTLSVGNVGSKTFTAIYDLGSNYNPVEVEVTVVVAPATPDAPVVDTLAATYGETLADVELPEGFVWVDSTASVGNAGTQIHAAIYNAGENYNPVEVAVTVEVAKADPETPEVGTLYATYGDEWSSIEVPAGFFIRTDGMMTVGDAGEKQITLIYTPTDGNNYNCVEVEVILVVAKAQAVVTELPTAPDSLVYTGAEQALLGMTGSTNGGVLVYSLDENGPFTMATPTAVDAGTYTVYYMVEGDGNYESSAVASVVVTIQKAESQIVTAPTANNSTYTGVAQTLVSGGTAEGGKLVYSLSENGEYTETIPTATNADVYTVYYKVQGDANHNDSAVSSVYVNIEKADPSFEIPTGLTATEGQTLADVSLDDYTGFTWDDDTVTVALGENTYAATYTPNDTANYNTVTVQITVTGEAKVVESVDKFAVALYEGEPAFLYRVGNINTVALSSLFKALDGVEIGTVSIKVDTLSGDAAGSYTANSTWTAGTIQFSGTGVVEVTISDETSKPCSVKLEVVVAKNITKAENATANNVVLLNDISGTFTVSNGNTFYGNGFTVKLPTTSVKNVGNGFTGYISLGGVNDDGSGSGGHLDNVRIEGPVYPEMYIYRDQAKITDTSDPDYGDGYNMRYFVNSVIVYGGNSTISNCYISGSRTALCLRGGNNVVIENTTLSGGAYANMQICAGSSVTLCNLTTIQVDVTDSYGKGKTAHGMGIAIDSNVVDVYIEGELKQYNWLNQTKWNEIVPSTYQSQFPKFFTDSSFSKYWHYLNGGTDPYVNMGFIFACNWDTSKIHDNRATVNYGTTSATIAGVAGGVYTKLNTVGGNAITDADLTGPAYVPTGFNPVAPVLNFDNSPNLDEDDANDAADTYCVYSESTGTLKIGVSGSSKTLDLSQVTVEKNGTALAHTMYLNGTAVTGNSVTIKAADGAKQTLTIKATSNDAGFDKDGNAIAGSIEYTWTVTVEVATLSYPAPVWNMGGDYEFDKTNLYYVYYTSSQGYGEAVPIYEGIKINYYDKNGTLVQKDFSGTTTHPTGSANSNSNAFTYTLSDGSTLVMKYSSGWKSGATTHQFATYSNKVYVYPQSLDNDNYVRAKTTNQDFDVKITYTFTDPNGQSISQTMRWYNAMASNGSVSTVQWKTFDTENGKKGSVCVSPDTLVTMADGTQKQIKNVTLGEEVVAWNFHTGKYDVVPVSLIQAHDTGVQNILYLHFEDGTQLKVLGEHGIYDANLNTFIFIDEDDVEEYIGHDFVKQAGDSFSTVKLVGYEVKVEYTTAYTILSAAHYNVILEGMFTVTPAHLGGNFFNPFDVDENMMYDEAKVQADIEKYGLYTYEEFAHVLTYEQFVALNIPQFKVSAGKGLITYDNLIRLITEFVNNEDFSV